MFDVGRLCVKTAGREIGKHCVVIGKAKEDGFVLVTGPKAATGVRRRRCNVAHLRPLEDMIDIKADASDEEILKVYEKIGFHEKFGVKERERFEGKRRPPGKVEKKEAKPAPKPENAAPHEKAEKKEAKPATGQKRAAAKKAEAT